MKIAILGTRGIPSGYSGYEAFAEEFGARMVERGHAVTVYAHANMFSERPEFYRGIRLVYLPSLKGKSTSQYSHSLLGSFHAAISDADVVLFCNVANGPFGLILKAGGKKCAINVDGLEWMRPKWGTLARKMFRLGARCSGLLFDSVITDAMGMQRVYKEEFGIESDDIAYGANVRYSENPSLVKEFGLEPYGYYLIASRLVPDNNADLIIRGFMASHSKRILAIAGGTKYKNPFEEECRRLGDDRVRFLGHINDSNTVAELHLNAFAYLHGHQYGGTNPALLKGLAYGNCILALDTVFNREVLDNGEYGTLYKKDEKDLAAKIDELEQRPDLVDSFRKKSRTRITQRYTWEHITDQYEAVFERIRNGKLK